MEKLIACCGLNCATCEARIATMADDDEMRAQTAEKWKVQYGASGMTPEMINCTGCREEGVKFSHCSECEIRKCVNSKDFETCANCEKLENCDITRSLHQYVPEALLNLQSLN
ncbi:MAG: DUF3795 domain-containing protein [Prolixibacteraceae bacterium]